MCVRRKNRQRNWELIPPHTRTSHRIRVAKVFPNKFRFSSSAADYERVQLLINEFTIGEFHVSTFANPVRKGGLELSTENESLIALTRAR